MKDLPKVSTWRIRTRDPWVQIYRLYQCATTPLLLYQPLRATRWGGGRGHCKISHVVFWRRMELCASTRTRKCWSLVPPGGIGRRSLTLSNSLHQCPSRTTMFYLSPWTFPRRSTRSITVGHTDAENGGLGLP